MNRVMIAGAAGQMGFYLLNALNNRNFQVKLLIRKEDLIEDNFTKYVQLIPGDASNPETLDGKLNSIDMLISLIGLRCKKNGYNESAHRLNSNLNLLNEALRAGIKKIIFLSSINNHISNRQNTISDLEILHEKIKATNIQYLLIRTNLLYSDMDIFLNMANTGKVCILGKGQFRLNPIHEKDLALFIMDSLDLNNRVLEAGGPDILTQQEIAQMALKAYQKTGRVIAIPAWIWKFNLTLWKFFNPNIHYNCFPTMLDKDVITPRCGILRLKTYFTEQADSIQKELDHF